MASKYNESDISYFSTDLEKIRAKPQLYIGPTDAAGVFTILREPCDNGVDEARAKRNNLIHIFVGSDGVLTIADAGVGIPVAKHPKAKISTLTHVLTALQSSGKMKGDAYTSSIGTHGVGIKATNALSSMFRVWTYRKDSGGWHYTEFAGGKEKKPVAKSKAPKLPDGTVPKLGTVIQFMPDTAIFGKHKLKAEQVRSWCEMTSYMNAGLKIKLTDPKGKTQEWLSKEGVVSYLNKRLTELKAEALNKKPLTHTSGTLELALSFADVEGCEVEFFTNTIRNIEQGVHADDFFRALTDSLKPYKGRLEYTPTDLREGVVGVLNYKIDAPQFDSQTKEKLVDQRVKGACYEECCAVLGAYFEANKTLAQNLVKRAAELRKKTNEFLKDKRLITSVRKARTAISSKLAAIDSKVPAEKRELYLVEGDSAGGTAKLARYKHFQAVFPLKGKPLNVMEAKKDRVLANAEVSSILAAIGLDIGADQPLKKLSYGKIVFLADPDVDGKHINCLLLALFWKYLPDLFKNGHIYMVVSPEYMAKYKGRVVFGMTKDALYKAAGTDKLDVQHIKGWGEIQAEDMRPIAFDPDGRRLWRVMPPRDKKGVLKFEALLGNDPGYRKKLLGVG